MLIASRTPGSQRGTSLLEALFAIALFSIGLLGLAGALASAMRAVDEARLRGEAAQLAHALVADMWTTATADLAARFAVDGPARAAWENRVASRLPAATTSVDLAEVGSSAQSRLVLVTVTWQRAGSSERHRYVTAAGIGRNS